MVFEGLGCGGPGAPASCKRHESERGAGRIIGPSPTGASAAGRSPAEKDKGRQGPGAFVRRIASAFTRSRRRPAFRALSLKKKGPRQIDRSEEHTSELQSLMRISYAVF